MQEYPRSPGLDTVLEFVVCYRHVFQQVPILVERGQMDIQIDPAVSHAGVLMAMRCRRKGRPYVDATARTNSDPDVLTPNSEFAGVTIGSAVPAP